MCPLKKCSPVRNNIAFFERFVNDWVGNKSASYPDHKRFGSGGDMGRDVVGYLSDRRMSGPWDNYQCKQLLKKLTAAAAGLELGKIFWHASQGAFALPRRYIFVAPRGYKRDIEDLIDHPDRFKPTFLANWNRWCTTGIVAKTRTALTPAVQALIQGYDFKAIELWDAEKLVEDPHVVRTLVSWFGYDPGKPPRGVVPVDLQPEETEFSSELLELYGEREGVRFADVAAVLRHEHHGRHLGLQRRRFFDAGAFRRFYRDNTPDSFLVDFNQDIHDGVIDAYHRPRADRLARLDEVMTQASVVSPAGILGHHSSVSVRQGTCHHFVNEGLLSWKA